MKSKEYRHVELFPEIFNKEAFLHRNHPSLRPGTSEWIEYWSAEKKKCIEGLWVEEKEGHWRWMYPKLYFYINHCKILLIDEVAKTRYPAYPDLTDVEWAMAAYHTACIGFSGFTGDKEYTCNRLVQKYEQEKNGELDEFGMEVNMTTYEKEKLQNNPHLREPFKTYKKYVDPFEYLKMAKDANLGYPLYENTPLNEFKMTARGTGKSYWDCGVSAADYTFDNAKYYRNEMFPDQKEGIAEIMIGAWDEKTTDEFAMKLEYMLHNFEGGFEDGKRSYPPPFFKNYMGTLKNGETYRNKYKKYENGRTQNITGSIVYTVNYSSNPHVGASKRLSRQVVDEAAYIEKVDEMHGVSKYSKKAGGVEFGNTSYSCTGGSFEKGDAAQRMFKNPSTYGIYPILDRWEGKGHIGFFIPATYSERKFKDENGNTRYELALEPLLNERERLERSPDPLPLIQEKMFNPLKPSEMFYSTRENILPGELATERINELEEQGVWDRLSWVGKLDFGNKEKTKAVWKEVPDFRKKVIKDLHLEQYKTKEGAWAVYEHPDDEIESVPNVVVYDPYKKDGQGESYASVLVYKGFPITSDSSRLSDDIVAEWIGRPFTIDEAHEQVVLACRYFKCKVLFERNVPGFITYCKTNNCTDILMEEPFDAVKEVNTKKKKTKEFGVNMNGALKQHYLHLFRKWLLQPLVYNEEGEVVKYNISKIKSLRLLHEIKSFGDGNFDHISAAIIMTIYITQMTLKPVDEKVEERIDEFDDFFSQHMQQFRALA